MKLFSWAKDGGPESPVEAYFLVEIKCLFSIAVLKFNTGAREAYHTHAFNALTWYLYGDLVEQDINGEYYIYERSLWPKITMRNKNHRVIAFTDSWAISIRGPWARTWTETHNNETIVLTHGRKRVE